MEAIIELVRVISAMPTQVLTLIVALAAVLLAGFAIYVVHVTTGRTGRKTLMARMLDWVALPTGWIEAGGLRRFDWIITGSDETAALLTLIVLAQHADQETGDVVMTYDELRSASSLSRTKIANALGLLEGRDIIQPGRRSKYTLAGYSRTGGWGKLPARALYQSGRLTAFEGFKLRSDTELHALKLYLTIVARRDQKTNMAHITYNDIAERTGIPRHRIRGAVSALAGLGLVHVEHLKSAASDHGLANAYRLPQIDPYVHMGTRGRKMEANRLTSDELF